MYLALEVEFDHFQLHWNTLVQDWSIVGFMEIASQTLEKGGLVSKTQKAILSNQPPCSIQSTILRSRSVKLELVISHNQPDSVLWVSQDTLVQEHDKRIFIGATGELDRAVEGFETSGSFVESMFWNNTHWSTDYIVWIQVYKISLVTGQFW